MKPIEIKTNDIALVEAALRCREARSLERRGEYEEARAQLASLFPDRIGDEPKTAGLTDRIRAEVYLRCGMVTAFYASARAIAEGQEAARQLLDYASVLFEILGDRDKESEALTGIAITFWRGGDLDQAHKLLEKSSIRAAGDEPRAIASINRAILFDTANEHARAISLLETIAPLVHEDDHHTAGIFYNTFSICHRRLGETQYRPEHFQIAIIHSTGACYHFEKLGHKRYLARAENVLGNLYRSTYQYKAAHEHLSCALRISEVLKDRTLAGQIYDTIAQTYRDEGRCDDAEKAARHAVRLLEDSGERGPLAEAYRTLSLILEGQQHGWEGFSLNDWLLKAEEKWIARALRESNGVKAHAAQKLKITDTALANRLKRTFPHLLLREDGSDQK